MEKLSLLQYFDVVVVVMIGIGVILVFGVVMATSWLEKAHAELRKIRTIAEAVCEKQGIKPLDTKSKHDITL